MYFFFRFFFMTLVQIIDRSIHICPRCIRLDDNLKRSLSFIIILIYSFNTSDSFE